VVAGFHGSLQSLPALPTEPVTGVSLPAVPELSAADPLAPLVARDDVAAAVGRARAAVDALLGNRALRRRSTDVSAESALRGAWASAWLAGAEHPLAQVRSGAAAADPVVQGALRAQAAIGTLADVWSRAPRQALARLHALAAADLVADPDLLGRPVPSAGVAARLDTLAAVLATTRAPAVVVAAIVHGEIVTLDAFAPASGVVARVAARLTLVDRGLDPKSLVVLEAGHRELAGDYRDAAAGFAAGTPDGVAAWLVHCADAVVAGAREATAICEAMARG
jgi:hypothetical protein